MRRMREWWCRMFGHRWQEAAARDGSKCRRCGEWRPRYVQLFGPIKISGPKATKFVIDDPLWGESPRDDR